MSSHERKLTLEDESPNCCCDDHVGVANGTISRREFVGGLSGAAALGGVALLASHAPGGLVAPAESDSLPVGKPLRVKPVLIYSVHPQQEKTSWRWYGGVQTAAEAQAEAQRIDKDMKSLAASAEFPVEFLPVAVVDTVAKAKEAADVDCDAILIFGAGHCADAIPRLLLTARPSIMFLRHRTKPHYFWYETASFFLLRNLTDSTEGADLAAEDVAVDDYGQILWRLGALYGLKNARGTKMLAIGGLQHYSGVGNKYAPPHAKDVWGYSVEEVSLADFGQRLAQAQANQQILADVEKQTQSLLSQPGVTLKTERKFVLNSFLALHVVKELLKETGASNFGFARCMARPVIETLDTPPCLVLALANDEGYTAYCHADLTHTPPGVLLRWIANRPSFVSNGHFPHDGVFTVAHCAAPRRMNGRDYDPAAIMTHYESDYGAAVKVQYPIGQQVTVVIPALNCTKWQGFKGKIIEAPSRPACRSQMDIQVEGNWRRLQTDQVGFHVQVCYGDWLREVGYALKKLGSIQWENLSDVG